jgi:hypothetical protein
VEISYFFIFSSLARFLVTANDSRRFSVRETGRGSMFDTPVFGVNPARAPTGDSAAAIRTALLASLRASADCGRSQ